MSDRPRILRCWAPIIIWFAASSVVWAADKLTIGATPTPAGEILEFIKPRLAREGVDLEVKIFTDYIQPNVQLVEGRLDGNFFQHRPFLDEFNRQKHTALVPMAAVLIAPLGAYSVKWKALAALPSGATLAIPNDPTNGARALLLLAQAGLLELSDPQNVLATSHDIKDNPRHLHIRELEAAMLPRVLAQVDLAVINTNYALEAKLDPQRDALLLEEADSPYVNVLVVRPESRTAPALSKLAVTLTSPEVRAFIESNYHGAVLSAF